MKHVIKNELKQRRQETTFDDPRMTLFGPRSCLASGVSSFLMVIRPSDLQQVVRTVTNLLPSDSLSQHLEHSSQVPNTIIGAYALRFMHPPPSLLHFTSFFATYHMHAHGRNICFGLKKRREEEERISVGRLSEIHTQDLKGRAGWRRRVTILLEFSSVQGS